MHSAGIFLLEANIVDIHDIKFHNNTASNGAAMYMKNTNNLTLENIKFINNKAHIFGGAFYSELN